MSTFFRSGVSMGNRGVDRSAKIIRGFAVCTEGEALGHGLWLDNDFLSSLVAQGNARPDGFKSRFTHPSIVDDGLGSYLGQTKTLRRDGRLVRGDLHIAEVASKTPKGDLGSYILDLAEQAPESFGASIVFSRDGDAEEDFTKRNSRGADFKSPDRENSKNLMHARLNVLRGCDVVDDPAANPGGMFSTKFSRGGATADASGGRKFSNAQINDFIDTAAEIAARENVPFGQAYRHVVSNAPWTRSEMEQHEFLTLSKSIQEKDGITLGQAMSRVVKMRPGLHEDFRNKNLNMVPDESRRPRCK